VDSSVEFLFPMPFTCPFSFQRKEIEKKKKGEAKKKKKKGKKERSKKVVNKVIGIRVRQ